MLRQHLWQGCYSSTVRSVKSQIYSCLLHFPFKRRLSQWIWRRSLHRNGRSKTREDGEKRPVLVSLHQLRESSRKVRKIYPSVELRHAITRLLSAGNPEGSCYQKYNR